MIGCGEKQEKLTQATTDVTHDSTQAAPVKMSPIQERQKADQFPMAFGEGGQIKMLYDRRQRPQSVYLNNKVHIVLNAGGQIGARPKAPTKPMATTYDPVTREFSEVVTLGPAKRDHHYGPVIWADEDDYLHVLFGCHRTPGTHLVSRQPGSIGSSLDSWDTRAQIAPGISYGIDLLSHRRPHQFMDIPYYK
jgi:hypothetical protein